MVYEELPRARYFFIICLRYHPLNPMELDDRFSLRSQPLWTLRSRFILCSVRLLDYVDSVERPQFQKLLSRFLLEAGASDFTPLFCFSSRRLDMVQRIDGRSNCQRIFFLLILRLFFMRRSKGHIGRWRSKNSFYLIWRQLVRRLRVERLQKLALGIAVVEPILRLIATRFRHFNFDYTFFRCDGLAIGALLACQLYRKERKLPAAGIFSGKATAIFIFLIACVFLAAIRPLLSSPRFYMQGSALFLTAVNLCFYSLIRITVENRGSRSFWIFRSAVLVFFGQISYCMYMSHTYVMRIYDDWIGPLAAGNTRAYSVRLVTVFGATIVLCIVSRYCLELPFMSLRKYVLRKPAPAVKVAS